MSKRNSIAEPEPPQPIHPSPGPNRPFPSPTPHIDIAGSEGVSAELPMRQDWN